MKKCLHVCILLSTFCVFSAHSKTYIACAKEAHSKLYGYIDRDGNYLIKPQFPYAYSFCKEGLAPIFDNLKGEIYFINTKGERVLSSNENYNLITPQEGEIVPPSFYNGILLVEKNGKYGCIDTQGKLVTEIKYDMITIFDEGLAIGKRENRFYILNQKKEELYELEASIDSMFHFSDGFARFVSDGKQGFVNRKGAIAIEAQFLYSGQFSCSLARACLKEQEYGYIDTLGHWHIKPLYCYASGFSKDEKLAQVRKKGTLEEGYVFTSGYFFHPEHGNTYRPFSNGLAQTSNKGKYGYINIFGQWEIPPMFEGSHGLSFSCDVCIVQGKHLLGIIDKTGNWRIKPKYSHLADFVEIENKNN